MGFEEKDRRFAAARGLLKEASHIAYNMKNGRVSPYTLEEEFDHIFSRVEAALALLDVLKEE